MTPEQRAQWTEEFIHFSVKEFAYDCEIDTLRNLIEKGYALSSELKCYLEARRKAQEEIDRLKNFWKPVIDKFESKYPNAGNANTLALTALTEAFDIHCKLEDRDREIERLKLDVKHGCSICATQPEVTITSLEEQLKERDELIRDCCGILNTCIPNKTWTVNYAKEWIEKAKKLVGEK